MRKEDLNSPEHTLLYYILNSEFVYHDRLIGPGEFFGWCSQSKYSEIEDTGQSNYLSIKRLLVYTEYE